MKLFIGATCLMGSVMASVAGVDLQVSVPMQGVSMAVEAPSGVRARATVTVKNSGTEAYRGAVSIRLIAVPYEVRANSARGYKGISFPSQSVDVDLAGGASVDVALESSAVRAFSGSYRVGAIVNSTRAVTEDSYLNNASPTMSSTVRAQTLAWDAPASGAANDLYSDVPFVTPMNGGAAHAWRLFKTGTVDTSNLRVLFLAADMSENRLIVADYGMQGEKDVGWGNMGQAVDEHGNVVPFDVYSQNPLFRDLNTSGRKALLTLVNSREEVVEADVNNNLDAHFFTVRKILFRPQNGSAVLASAEARSEQAMDIALPPVISHFGRVAESTVSITGASDWAQLTESANGGPVTLRLSAANLDPGIYQLSLVARGRLTAEAPPSTDTLPVTFEVHAPGTIAALRTESHLRLVALPGTTEQRVRLPLVNTGTAPLAFRVDVDGEAANWIQFPRTQEGILLPGQRVNLPVRIQLTGMAPDSEVHGMLFVGSTAGERQAVEITVRMAANLPVFPMLVQP